MEDGPRAHIRHIFPVVSAAVLLTMLVAPVTARADTSMAGKSAVRLVDLSSDPEAADFYVDGNRAWSGVAYKTVSNYIEVGPGNHVYEVRKARSPADSPSLARVQGMMKPDSYYTVMIAGRFESLKASVFDDGSSAMPTSDICQARFINATPDLTIDVTVRGLNASFPNLGFLQTSSYGQLPKGVYDVEIKDRANQKVIATVQNFVAPGGHMHSLAAAGGKGNPVELVEFYDAMTAEALPEGAAHTGMGGSQRAVSLPPAWAVLPAALLASVLALAGLRRFSH
jgi:uncharacterized protein DUF4397